MEAGIFFVHERGMRGSVAEAQTISFFPSGRGGTTPRDVYAQFYTTIVQQDDEAATQFFVTEKKEEWRQRLHAWKDGGRLADFLATLPEPETITAHADIAHGTAQLTYARTVPESAVTIRGQVFHIPAGRMDAVMIARQAEDTLWYLDVL